MHLSVLKFLAAYRCKRIEKILQNGNREVNVSYLIQWVMEATKFQVSWELVGLVVQQTIACVMQRNEWMLITLYPEVMEAVAYHGIRAVVHWKNPAYDCKSRLRKSSSSPVVSRLVIWVVIRQNRSIAIDPSRVRIRVQVQKTRLSGQLRSFRLDELPNCFGCQHDGQRVLGRKTTVRIVLLAFLVIFFHFQS